MFLQQSFSKFNVAPKLLLDSAIIFFQLREAKESFSFLERVLALPILGSLAIALRRKLERRVRH